MGITRIANVTGLDCIGIPVTMVCRPNASSLAVSQGKGVDLDAARASGVMEAIELYHAENITHPLKLASWNQLRFSHKLVTVEKLPRTSISTFDANKTVLWIEGADVTNAESTWLPFEVVHTDCRLPFPTGTGSFVLSSNGLASGNHRLEAVSHALSEVIERDAMALLAHRSAEAQDALRVDIRTIADHECRRLLDLFDRAGVLVGVWDGTSDVGISAFRCLIVDREPSPLHPLGPVEGMGCHPVREVALSRALTEAAQSRLTFIAGSRDDAGRARYDARQDTAHIERIQASLLREGRRSFEASPSQVNEYVEEDIATLLDGLHRAGLEQIVVVDLTKPEFGIPVVRVVVPGLEPYHHIQGYVPGPRAHAILEAEARG
jgi:ribosomal protein S12 methylthiotransferase accessory factor